MRFFFLTSLLLTGVQLFAQERAYLDNSYHAASEDNACYFYYPDRVRQVVVDNDSISIYSVHFLSGGLHTLGGYLGDLQSRRHGNYYRYAENGTLVNQASYLYGTRKGEYKSWYESGVIKSEMNFFGSHQYEIIQSYDSLGNPMLTDGSGQVRLCDENMCESGEVLEHRKHGMWTITENGKVIHTEQYDSGTLVSGIYYAENGEITYNELIRNATFPTGMYDFYSYIANNLRYPDYARKNYIEGKVYVRFLVMEDGTLSGIRINRSPHNSLSRETLRIMSKADPWEPSLVRGRPTVQEIVVPVIFMLN